MTGEAGHAAKDGRDALDRGELDAAEAALCEAVELDPSDNASWYNLALVHKFRRDWAQALHAGLRAVDEQLSGRDDPAWWNLGIAATALREWSTARRAWQAYGITIPPGDGEIVADLGITPVRINPQEQAEVVWGVRLDPARVRLLSVPTPESGHRWGDVVLHDGEPRGERRAGRATYQVFDELELWQRSATPTFAVQLRADSQADVDALVDALEEAGGGAEDWSTMRLICAECSLGRPGHSHEHAADSDWQPDRTVGIAAPRAVIDEVLPVWSGADPSHRSWSEITEVG